MAAQCARRCSGALFVGGFLAGALEINVNLETDQLEALLGRRIMNRAHGMWSLGFFITALIGGRHAPFRRLDAMCIPLASCWRWWRLIIGLLTVTGMIDGAATRPGSHEGEHPDLRRADLGLLPLCA